MIERLKSGGKGVCLAVIDCDPVCNLFNVMLTMTLFGLWHGAS